MMAMLRLLRCVLRNDRASSATEMALAVPLLLTLMLGAFELGNYFMTEHKVVKAVRDGARYAARRPFTDYAGCTPSSGVVDDTRNVTRTGAIASGGTPVVGTWTDPASITVTTTCAPGGTYTGIYVTSPVGTPVVTVAATVPYATILGQLGLADPAVRLRAQSEAAVTGI
jgi:Flp pilus assembly protein TadG